jgi:hypothetical protein
MQGRWALCHSESLPTSLSTEGTGPCSARESDIIAERKDAALGIQVAPREWLHMFASAIGTPRQHGLLRRGAAHGLQRRPIEAGIDVAERRAGKSKTIWS